MDISLPVLIALCPECMHGRKCPGFRRGDAPNNGVTCLNYAAKLPPKSAMKPAHILALPDREPCDECACRKDTAPNKTHHTMADFRTSIEQLTPFLCHGEGRNRICSGWLRAAKAQIRGEHS